MLEGKLELARQTFLDIGGQVSVNGPEFQRLLDAIGALKQGAGWHWQNAVPIFLSSLGGLLVGIVLDLVKRSWDSRKARNDKNATEIQQIKAVLEGTGHNLTMLLHITAQNLIPHHSDSKAAYIELLTTTGDQAKLDLFMLSFYRYRALMMTCPPMYFVECDFTERLPFLANKAPNLVLQSAGQIQYSRALLFYVNERNKLIDSARSSILPTGTATFAQIRSDLQSLSSLSEAECVAACELFDVLLSTIQNLQRLVEDDEKKLYRLEIPEALEIYHSKLRAIRAEAVKAMPA